MHWIAGEKIEKNELVYQDPETLKLFVVREKKEEAVLTDQEVSEICDAVDEERPSKEFQEALEISNTTPPQDLPDHGAGV